MQKLIDLPKCRVLMVQIENLKENEKYTLGRNCWGLGDLFLVDNDGNQLSESIPEEEGKSLSQWQCVGFLNEVDEEMAGRIVEEHQDVKSLHNPHYIRHFDTVTEDTDDYYIFYPNKDKAYGWSDYHEGGLNENGYCEEATESLLSLANSHGMKIETTYLLVEFKK